MTSRNEVLAMAREAGLKPNRYPATSELERFHALAFAAGRAAEREECAKDKVDAERYRWLVANAAVVTGEQFNWRSAYGHPMIDSTLDAAIDRARSAK